MHQDTHTTALPESQARRLFDMAITSHNNSEPAQEFHVERGPATLRVRTTEAIDRAFDKIDSELRRLLLRNQLTLSSFATRPGWICLRFDGASLGALGVALPYFIS